MPLPLKTFISYLATSLTSAEIFKEVALGVANLPCGLFSLVQVDVS